MRKGQFHKKFQLNQQSFFTVNELIHFSKSLSTSIHQFLKQWFSSSHFIVIQTSGSTGVPKSIQLKKELMVNSALATGKYFDLQEDTTALLCLSTDYIAGKMMLVRALVLGWKLDFVEPTSSPMNQLTKQYDFSAMVPLQLQNSWHKIFLIKKLIVGGGEVSNELIKKIQTIQTDVFATYGMTETVSHIAIKKLNHLIEKPSFYKLLPEVSIYKDVRDCLVIEAPKVAPKIVFTNDVVALVSDVQFEWIGRFDNVINSSGIKLYPEKIEKKMSKIIKERFFVAGIPDPILGKKLVLFVEFDGAKSKKYKAFLEAEIKNQKSFSKYEIPKEIYFVNQFVDTETKKIQREKTLKLVGTLS